MSELNRRKMGPLLKLVVIYSIIAITITITSMYMYKKTGKTVVEYLEETFTKEKVEESIIKPILEESDKEDYNNIKRTNKFDKYSLNNIKTISKEIKKGPIVNYDYEGFPMYKLEANYIRIEGLKNIDVQEKMNNEIII